MYLYHYYDKDIGPFKNISELSEQEAYKIMLSIAAEKPGAFCNHRTPDYLGIRHYYEDILRNEFLKKGGLITRLVPHYMVIGECRFLQSWYENSAFIKIDIGCDRADRRRTPAPGNPVAGGGSLYGADYL